MVGGEFLPPANEVWGKVMLLHLSVCFMRAGVGVGFPTGGMSLQGKGILHPGGRGLPTRGKGSAFGRLARAPHTKTRKAGRTHPTGMLSCCDI